MAVTPLEQLILDQADAIRARESGVDSVEVTDEMIELAKQGGTEQHVEMLLARKENRDPRHLPPNPVGNFGAAVPPSQVRDAATHQPLVMQRPDQQPSESDLDSDPTAPVREGEPDVAPYEDWSKPELIEEAKVRELPTNGTKDDLSARLREDDAQYKAMTSPEVVDGDDTPPV
jgi:hypothetical protein